LCRVERDFHLAPGSLSHFNYMNKKCKNYLGDRGITDDITKCAEYKNLWFIVFCDYPEDVEISFKNNIHYECYDEIPINDMVWSKKNYEKIYQEMQKNRG